MAMVIIKMISTMTMAKATMALMATMLRRVLQVRRVLMVLKAMAITTNREYPSQRSRQLNRILTPN